MDILYTVDEIQARVNRLCGTKEIGIDKGYTEVCTDSDGERYGKGLGELLSKESDHNNEVYVARQKIAAVGKKPKMLLKQHELKKLIWGVRN